MYKYERVFALAVCFEEDFEGVIVADVWLFDDDNMRDDGEVKLALLELKI